jgi:hypothetical protein
MSFTITKRFCDVVTRWLEVNWDEIIEDAPESVMMDTVRQMSWSENAYVQVASERVYHKKTCDSYNDENGEAVYLDEKCEECEAVPGTKLIFSVETPKGYACIKHTIEVNKFAYIDGRAEDYYDRLLHEVCVHIRHRWEGKTWTPCKWCDIKALDNEDLCEYCYIHQYERTEEEGGDCCICHENNGVWVKLTTCNHILHLHCCNKMDLSNGKPRCPLCRQVFDFMDKKCNPYDV